MKTSQPQVAKPGDSNGWIAEFLKTGDKNYLGQVYEANKKRLFFHCLRLLNNEEDAKDATSDAFIRAFDNIRNFDIKRPFYPWLARIATNLCIDFIRKRKWAQLNTIDEEKVKAKTENSLDALQRKELGNKIKWAMDKLKKPQKRCFYLFYIQEKSYKEIVQIMGYSYNRVRSCIQNGRRNFKLAMATKN